VQGQTVTWAKLDGELQGKVAELLFPPASKDISEDGQGEKDGGAKAGANSMTDGAASTAKIESAWEMSMAARVITEGQIWSHPRAGLRVRVPVGWAVGKRQGVEFLWERNAGGQDFAPNLHV